MSEVINGDAGRVGFIIRGDYDSAATYDFLDIVYYGGASYVAKKVTTGNPPVADNEFWKIFAGMEIMTAQNVIDALGYAPARKSVYDDTLVSMGRSEETVVGTKSFAFGVNVESSGYISTAIGSNTKATGNQSYAEGYLTISSGGAAHAEGGQTTASSNYAHAEGYGTVASNPRAHSEGYKTTASGYNSHSEGWNTYAFAEESHAEGENTTAFARSSHASGSGSVCIGNAAHAEGAQTISGNGYILHVKSVNVEEHRVTFTETYEGFEDAFAKISPGVKMHVINIQYINDRTIFTVKNVDTSSNSVIVEEDIPAKNYTPWLAVLSVPNTANATAHAEGHRTIASGDDSHAEGRETIASGSRAHAEGLTTLAKGQDSHAEGNKTTASGNYSHAEGQNTVASGFYSHAAGTHTIANESGQTVIGSYNNTVGNNNSNNNPFIVGNGTSTENRSNAFRVYRTGAVYAKGNYNSSGADYAEFIRPWHDGNENDEDRVGYFVTVKDGYLYKANEGDYIIGVTSGNPSVVGNSDEEYYWRWERDEFNRVIYEEVPEMTEKMDENGDFVIDEATGKPVMEETGRMQKVPKQSEDYDSTLQQSYTERKDRKEWDYVGMVGVVPVRDDGTCEVGSYCKCGGGGIATLADNRGFDTYMVLDRISDNVVSVILK